MTEPQEASFISESNQSAYIRKVFLSYKRGVDPDERLAEYFSRYLSEKGHTVFRDTSIEIGQEWPTAIETALNVSTFFIVLLSGPAIASDMIIREVAIAYDLKRRRGNPTILPIHLGLGICLPYDLAAYLARIQHVIWDGEGAESEIASKLDQAIRSNQSFSGRREEKGLNDALMPVGEREAIFVSNVTAGADGAGKMVGLSPQQKGSLAEALLSCDSMRRPMSRQSLFEQLPSHIYVRVERSNNAFDDVLNVVQVCSTYPEGLFALVSRVYDREGGSYAGVALGRLASEMGIMKSSGNQP